MKLNSNFVIKEVLGNYILIDLSDEFKNVIKLNETSKYIVECVQQNLSKEEIIDKMSKEYKVEKEILSNDINELINNLKKLNIINDWRAITKAQIFSKRGGRQ